MLLDFLTYDAWIIKKVKKAHQTTVPGLTRRGYGAGDS